MKLFWTIIDHHGASAQAVLNDRWSSTRDRRGIYKAVLNYPWTSNDAVFKDRRASVAADSQDCGTSADAIWRDRGVSEKAVLKDLRTGAEAVLRVRKPGPGGFSE